MKGLKLTDRGQMVVGILQAVGTTVVLLGCIAAGWAFLAVIAP